MPWNLLILPLAAGYYLLTRLKSLKYKQQRLDRQRLIFDSVLWGIVILISTITIRYGVQLIFPNLIDVLYSYSPIKSSFVGTTFSSFILTVVFTVICNLTVFKNPEKQIEKAIKSVGNELELLLRSSVKDSKMLQFTLDSDKVYVAWVKELPIPKVTNYIRVIPVFSGYRESDKNLVFTTHYLTIYSEYIKEGKVKGIEELDVDLIITLDNVVTVSYFDQEMYERFNSTV